MGFYQSIAQVSGRRKVFVVILTILAYSSADRCSEKEMCVDTEICEDGKIATHGAAIISERIPNTGTDCDEYGKICCLPPENNPVSDESIIETSPVASTTEEPDDVDWSRQCGQRTNVSERSDHENETNRFEFPWNVAVFSVTKLAKKLHKEFLCGGTLIHDYIVITAARCVNHKHPASLRVEMGRWDLNAGEEYRTQAVTLDKVIVHQGYVPSSFVDNIALLILKDSANLNRAVNRVCLADRSIRFDGHPLCYVVGWSNSPKHNIHNRQLKLRSDFVTAEECTNSVRRANRVLEFQLPKENSCLEYPGPTVPCKRAPGSGLVCESGLGEGDQYFLMGIASYSVRNCDQSQVPDVFLNIRNYIEWIDEHVLEQGYQPSFYRPDPSDFDET